MAKGALRIGTRAARQGNFGRRSIVVSEGEEDGKTIRSLGEGGSPNITASKSPEGQAEIVLTTKKV